MSDNDLNSTIRHGVAWFPDSRRVVASDKRTTRLGEFWAAIENGTPRKMKDIYSLPSNVIWVTNLEGGELFSLNKNRNPNFKNKNWLKTDLSRLAREIGVDPDYAPMSETAMFLSAVVSRVAQYAKSKLSIDKLTEQTLHTDILKAIRPPKKRIADEFYPAIQEIASHFVISGLRHSTATHENEIATFGRNRLAHARTVMETPIPAEVGWMLRKNSKKMAAEDFVATLDGNYVLKATIHHTQRSASFAAGWSGAAKSPREWFTDVEYNALKVFCDFEVHAAIVNEQPPSLITLDSILGHSDMAGLSITHSLVAEAVCASFLTPQKSSFNSDTSEYSTAAAWYRAKDKVLCLQDAVAMHDLGHPINSFGNGFVRLNFPERGLEPLIKDAIKIQLLPEAHSMMRVKQAKR